MSIKVGDKISDYEKIKLQGNEIQRVDKNRHLVIFEHDYEMIKLIVIL